MEIHDHGKCYAHDFNSFFCESTIIRPSKIREVYAKFVHFYSGYIKKLLRSSNFLLIFQLKFRKPVHNRFIY